MEIYLMRHGQTGNNVNGQFTGQTDVPMTEEGIRQIQGVASLLQDVRWDRVVSSPLQRAYQTASIVAPSSSIETFPWLMEMDFGRWSGLTWKQAEALDPEEWKIYNEDWKYGVAGGAECFMDVYRRVETGIHELIDTSDPNDRILIASHGAPVSLIPMILLELPDEAYWRLIPAQGVYSKLTAKPEPGFPLWFSLAMWNVGPAYSFGERGRNH